AGEFLVDDDVRIGERLSRLGGVGDAGVRLPAGVGDEGPGGDLDLAADHLQERIVLLLVFRISFSHVALTVVIKSEARMRENERKGEEVFSANARNGENA